MKILSSEILQDIAAEKVKIPTSDSFDYPEKVLQFGTGVLLRGLPDYYIDKANKQKVFQGRVAVVKSTPYGSIDDFVNQNGLFTLCVKGMHQDRIVEEYALNNAISRVIEASYDWAEILKIAASPKLEIIISNTTEVGIVLSEDKISVNPPASFPGKLLRILYHRYEAFDGDLSKGLVILPTELITDNGIKLKEIVLTLTDHNGLSDAFKNWLLEANDFCNTLVDRIVPGKLPLKDQEIVEQNLGFKDNLMIMAEPFSLWAIESSSDRVIEKLSFAKVDSSVRIVPSINKYKEIKLRLLNATHTFSCAAALLSGFQTVREAMQDDVFKKYVKNLMELEIGTSITSEEITAQEVNEFSNSVIDRFSNPFLDHQWTAIAMNYSSKIAMRCIPLLAKWYSKYESTPHYMSFGIASFLIMHAEREGKSTDELIQNNELWEQDLMIYPDFVNEINANLEKIANHGVLKAIAQIA